MTPEALAALPYRPCVGIMMINARGLIFAGQRIDSALPAWQMPQGGIDKGEEPLDAAFRELEEEIGVTREKAELLTATADWLTYDLPVAMVPNIWKGRYRGQKQKWFLMRYLGQDTEIRLDQESPEFNAWRWIGADDMIAAIVPFKRAIYEQVVDAFAPYLAGRGRA